MKPCLLANSVWIITFLACASCKDDPGLAAKRDHQRTEIVRLQGELALAKERLENLPENKASQLESAEMQLKNLAMEATRLEAEVADLRERKANLEKDFARYKRKYPLN